MKKIKKLNNPVPPKSEPSSPKNLSRRRWLLWGLGAVTAGGVGIYLATNAQQNNPGYEIVNTFPHDPQAFTQGLVYHDGFLYEGTGHYGRSKLLKVNLQTGRPEQEIPLAANIFGEGIALWQNTIIQLTWENEFAIVYDRQTFQELRRLEYEGEGWGLTHDGQHLIMSNGSATLTFRDPANFREVRRVTVTDGLRLVDRLNELEYINEEIYANVWYEDRIARISPQTGEVISWLDLTGLRPTSVTDPHAVLNGIAYDAQEQRLFVTGKNWPNLFEIRPMGQ